MEKGGKGICCLKDSIRNSFNESLRSSASTLRVFETRYPVDELPVGLIARAAVWRQPDLQDIIRFLAGARQIDLSLDGVVVEDRGQRKTLRLIKAQLTMLGEEGPVTKFPATRGLFFVGASAPEHFDYIRLAPVPWTVMRIKGSQATTIPQLDTIFEQT